MQIFEIKIKSICIVVMAAIFFAGASENSHAQKPIPDRSNDISPELVVKSISRGKQYLLKNQAPDGSWSYGGGGNHKTGMTSLAMMTLIHCGMTKKDPEIKKALRYLRNVKMRDLKTSAQVYETSLMIMALSSAKDGATDLVRIGELAISLEKSQVTQGKNSGMWGYSESKSAVDNSNTQFALLGLRDAAHAGIPIDRAVWERAHKHWVDNQNPDGGWGYSRNGRSASHGSMSVAGISSLSITSTFLQPEKETDAQGNPICCQPVEPNAALERGINWMSKNFSTRSNPAQGNFWLYYMYGLERAGRMSGRRFFGKHDWYRAGIRTLLQRQSARTGGWKGINFSESNQVLSSCYALLFLSKGLSPVLINKVKFGPRLPNLPQKVIGDIWNKHPQDARHLAEYISKAEGWPKLVTWQTVDLQKAAKQKSLTDLSQSPILYISSDQNIMEHFTTKEIELLKEYIMQGGFILATRNCQSEAFDKGIRELVTKMYPDKSASLKPLQPDHPIYRSWHLLDSSTVKLEGVEVGCRTAIVYASEDLSCLWDKWSPYNLPKRLPQMKLTISRSLRIATNIIAYATGGELLNKLDQAKLTEKVSTERAIKQGYLKIAKIRHTGDWDAAPNAVRNLLKALQKSVNASASGKPVEIPASDPNLFRYSLVYLHGQRRFTLNDVEKKQLKTYLNNGGTLFADSCCGASRFDRSFRQLMKELYPKKTLKRIPNQHELFSVKIGHDLKKVRRRGPESNRPGTAIKTVVKEVEPFLEGIEIDGRFAIIYSKYDISCALERQSSVACSGYIAEDALKIAINVVLYAILQDSQYTPQAEPKKEPLETSKE